MRKFTLAAGFGLGYLLGTKAGRARYEQIMRSLRGLRSNPAVQETAGVVQAQAVDLLNTAKEKVGDKLSGTKVGEKISAKVGRGSGLPDYSAGSNGVVR